MMNARFMFFWKKRGTNRQLSSNCVQWKGCAVHLGNRNSFPDWGTSNFSPTIDERTKTSLMHKGSKWLCAIGLFLSSHLSKFKVLCTLVGVAYFRRWKVCFFVQKDSVNHKLADDDGALPLNNKASYMIKLILVSQS